MLGVVWKRDDIEELREQETSNRPRKAPDELFIPLSLVMEPSLQDHIKKMFGRRVGIDAPDWAKKGELVDLYEETNQEGFLNFMGQFIRPKIIGK